eukprot:6180996-Pleurochrysis_carterae.AAC.3
MMLIHSSIQALNPSALRKTVVEVPNVAWDDIGASTNEKEYKGRLQGKSARTHGNAALMPYG